MAKDFDPYRLSSPQIYLWRMIIFLVIAAMLAVLLYRPIWDGFLANPGLNGTILAVGVVGVVLTLRQVLRLFGEVRWVNSFRTSDPRLAARRPPVLLAPMAALLGGRDGESTLAISPQTNRSILDSVASRLDEARELSRYMTGLLIFLGLLGTFWGLLQTITSVGDTIRSLDVASGEAATIFEDLKLGLEAPLGGMGTAFSSSLFGLAGSLVLGFLDLQAGQAQNRFYTDLEDWLSSLTEIEGEDAPVAAASEPRNVETLRDAVDRLAKNVQEGGGKTSTAAITQLAEGIQGLVQHMRQEQQLVRKWAEQQGEQQQEIKRLLEILIEGPPPEEEPAPGE